MTTRAKVDQVMTTRAMVDQVMTTRAMVDQAMTVRAMKRKMRSLLDTQSLNVRAKVANPSLLTPMHVISQPQTKTPIAMEEMEVMD